MNIQEALSAYWPQVPADHNYIAMDYSGHVNSYRHEPVKLDSDRFHFWVPVGSVAGNVKFLDILTDTDNWGEALVKRA